MKSIGVILAGGSGTRMYPITLSTNKHLLPIYSKPMIYYSLATLLYAGEREIVLVTDSNNKKSFKNLLGDGSKFGINIQYAFQDKPDGLASALLSAKHLLKGKKVKVILGDNIFHGKGLEKFLEGTAEKNDNVLFSQKVNNPENLGILKRSDFGEPEIIIEKPKEFVSNEAILGLYYYDTDLISLINQLKPSVRGELEITDLNNLYLQNKKMEVINIGRGITWYDAGTIQDLHSVSSFIQSIESQQLTLISSIEEIVLKKNYISESQFIKLAKNYKNTNYGEKLLKILE